ncbi:MAG: hypothetical protein ACT4QB_06105 [Gammaproteobacteria bacterium]
MAPLGAPTSSRRSKPLAGASAGPGGAAELLGLKYTTLQSRMQKLGITRKP